MTEETKQIWNDVRFWMELAYFASGIVLCVIAAIGLRQLKIAKRNIAITSKREAVKLASEQCSLYAAEVIPKINTLDRAVRERDIKLFTNSEVFVEGDHIRIKSGFAPGDFEKMKDLAVEITAVYNALETFSVFLLAGLLMKMSGSIVSVIPSAQRFVNTCRTFFYTVKMAVIFGTFLHFTSSGTLGSNCEI